MPFSTYCCPLLQVQGYPTLRKSGRLSLPERGNIHLSAVLAVKPLSLLKRMATFLTSRTVICRKNACGKRTTCRHNGPHIHVHSKCAKCMLQNCAA